MKDELMLAGIALGALYLTGSLKVDGESVAGKAAANFASGVAQGAVGAVGGAVGGAVEGTKAGANEIYAAGQQAGTGVEAWAVPVTGGVMKAAPLNMLFEGLKNPNVLWNLLPGLPDY